METQPTKRYLVTFANSNILITEAEQVLGLASGALASGEKLILESAAPGATQPVHFEGLGISAVNMSDEQATALRSSKEILDVEEDREMHILGFIDPNALVEQAPATSSAAAPNYMWNIKNVKAPAAWGRNIQGDNVRVAVLDTGIAQHPNLVISGGVSFIPGVTSYNDGNGHGTHCAGIIAAQGQVAPNGFNVFGVAPQCDLYAVKVLSDAGSGQTTWILSGMQWCITNGIQVASMSLGSSSGPSTAYATAIQQCQNNGVTVVCAAGNSFQTTFPWVCAPANSFVPGMSNESPVAVAAVDQNNAIAYFSSRGGQNANWNQVGVSAPGVAIYSTYLNNGYQTMSGTSMACPHVSGIAALIIQRNGNIAPALVAAKMQTTATNLGTAPYPNQTFGYGLINCELATR